MTQSQCYDTYVPKTLIIVTLGVSVFHGACAIPKIPSTPRQVVLYYQCAYAPTFASYFAYNAILYSKFQ